MLLFTNGNVSPSFRKFKKGDDVIPHELGSYRPAHQTGKLLPAYAYILFDLDDAELVPAGFRVHRNDVPRSGFVDADINLVRFGLTKFGYPSSEMALGRVARDTQKYVDEPIVS